MLAEIWSDSHAKQKTLVGSSSESNIYRITIKLYKYP